MDFTDLIEKAHIVIVDDASTFDVNAYKRSLSYFDANLIKKGISDYLWIQNNVHTDLFLSDEFKKRFNRFYRIRQKSQKWYEAYYNLFAKCAQNPMPFRDMMLELGLSTHEMHPSFCSKMLATLNPNKPIWDKYVLQQLGFTLNNTPTNGPVVKANYYADIYNKIEEEYNTHRNDENVIAAIEKFDKEIPEAKNLTFVKKLDLILWSKRSDKTISILEYQSLLNELNKLKND